MHELSRRDKIVIVAMITAMWLFVIVFSSIVYHIASLQYFLVCALVMSGGYLAIWWGLE